LAVRIRRRNKRTGKSAHPTGWIAVSHVANLTKSFLFIRNSAAMRSLVFPLPPLGFRGLDLDRPVRRYLRHLPHWRQDGATYFVTFRLADSIPEAKLIELQNLRNHWEYTHPEPRSMRIGRNSPESSFAARKSLSMRDTVPVTFVSDAGSTN
jgi:hypothetical protein